MMEPIEHFLSTYGINPERIKRVTTGEKYVAVELMNGNIGVCATLFNPVKADLKAFMTPDVCNIQHRILLNAYFNAEMNYRIKDYGEGDIFEVVDFYRFSNIVMVGYFRPLAKKLREAGIAITIFDKLADEPAISPQNELLASVTKSDCLILTATSIFNNTFTEIVNHTPKDNKTFVLGPSSVLHWDMFCYPNIQMVFGIVFPENAESPLPIIAGGGGTRDFLPLARKVFIQK